MLNFLQALAKLGKPEKELRESLLKSIDECAKASGLTISDCPGGRKVSGKETAVAVVQFGGRREFYETLELLEKEQADYRAIITSSNVKSMNIGEMKWLLNNKYNSKNKWLIIDIEHKESPKTVNFMLYGGEAGEHQQPQRREHAPDQPKRKKIYGRRGEHKVQD